MAGLGGMNFGQNMSTTQQGGTLQSLPGMGTSTAPQTQQSAVQMPSTMGYTPRNNQNVFGYNMSRLASVMDPSATLPFYNQYASPYYQQQQNINPYQGFNDILGSFGSFFNQSIAPTFQSAYDQQFQNFQNQLNQMSQRFAAPPPPPPPDYMSELQALRQEIARIQNPFGSVSGLYQNILGREGEQAGLDYWNQRFGNTIDPNEIEEFRRAAAQELSQRSQPSAPPPASTVSPITRNEPSSTNVNTQNQPQNVTGLYQSILGRAPEAAGLDYWNQRFGNIIEPNEIEEFRRAAAQELSQRSQQPTPSPAPTVSPITTNDPRDTDRDGFLSGQEIMNSFGASDQAILNNFLLQNRGFAGGGEIEAFNPAMNSGAASNLMSSGERVQDLGPGYRELGVLPGNVTEQTVEGLYRDILGRSPENAEVAQNWQSQFGSSIDLDEISQFRKAAQPELNIRRGTNEGAPNGIAQKGPGGQELTYRNGVFGYYRDLEPGENTGFTLLGNENYDPQTRKMFVPFSGARMKKGGMVHKGMSNRLKHMLK